MRVYGLRGTACGARPAGHGLRGTACGARPAGHVMRGTSCGATAWGNPSRWGRTESCCGLCGMSGIIGIGRVELHGRNPSSQVVSPPVNILSRPGSEA